MAEEKKVERNIKLKVLYPIKVDGKIYEGGFAMASKEEAEEFCRPIRGSAKGFGTWDSSEVAYHNMQRAERVA